MAERRVHTHSDHLGFLSPHILLHLPPFLWFFPLADYTTHPFIPFFIHSSFPVTKENVIRGRGKDCQIILLFVLQLIKAMG
jgi:hypothetical protein